MTTDIRAKAREVRDYENAGKALAILNIPRTLQQAIDFEQFIVGILAEERYQAKKEVLRSREVQDMRAVIIGGNRHDSQCLWHLDETYPCPHHQTTMAFDKFAAEILKGTEGEK